jgi:hypothetical protein
VTNVTDTNIGQSFLLESLKILEKLAKILRMVDMTSRFERRTMSMIPSLKE